MRTIIIAVNVDVAKADITSQQVAGWIKYVLAQVPSRYFTIQTVKAVSLVALVVVGLLCSGCVVSINGTSYECSRDDLSFSPSFTCVVVDDAPLVIGHGPITGGPVGRTDGH